MNKIISIIVFTCFANLLQAQVNIITIAGCCDSVGYGGDHGLATNAKLNFPEALCLSKDGNIYIADVGNNRIRKLNLSTRIISTIAGIDSGGYNGDGIPATASQLFIPSAVVTDTTGNIYIGDGLNHRIRKINKTTGIISTIAGNGNIGNTGDGGAATNAEIYGPVGLTFDKFSNLYIADCQNHNVRKVAPNGIISTIAGNGTPGFTGDGGPATDATFNTPSYAIMDNYGNIIIDDNFNCAMRKIDATTGIVTTIAGNGTCGYRGDGGLAVHALVSYPYGIFIDKQNDIYFAEYGNGVIRKIDGTTGIISTVVGCGVSGFGGDGGPATAAKLIPDGLVIDSNGVMYIADYGNNRIRMVYNTKLETSPQPSPKERVPYPNPATDELHIDNCTGCEVRIFNLLGVKVSSFDRLRMTLTKETIDIHGLIPGVYVVRIMDENGEVWNYRVVKE